MASRLSPMFLSVSVLSLVSILLFGFPEPDPPFPEYQICADGDFLYADTPGDAVSQAFLLRLAQSVDPALLKSLAALDASEESKGMVSPGRATAGQRLAPFFVRDVAHVLDKSRMAHHLAQARPCM